MDFTKKGAFVPTESTAAGTLSVMDLVRKKRKPRAQKSGKKRPLSEHTQRAEALLASMIAAEYWNLDFDPGSYGVSTKYTPSNFNYKRLPPWYTRNAKKTKSTGVHRLFICHEYLLANPDIVPLSVSINLSPLTAKTVKNATDIEYPCKIIREAVQPVIGDVDYLSWFTLEYTKSGRPHLHGCIGLSPEIVTDDIIKAMSIAIATSSICAKRKENNYNKTVLISRTWVNKHDGNKIEQVNDGWLRYSTKGYRPYLPNGTREPLRFAISVPLKGYAKPPYEALRAGLRTR